jgi:hypothetical protein
MVTITWSITFNNLSGSDYYKILSEFISSQQWVEVNVIH